MRIRGALQAAAGAMAGGLLFALWSRIVGAVVLVVASILLLAALLSPTGLYAAIQRLFAATGRATGRVLTAVLMTLLFTLFFLPFGRLLRRGRRDRLCRTWEPGASTYWEPHCGPRAGSSSRERQY